MSELYAKLLAELAPFVSGQKVNAALANRALGAARAVLELHKPIPCGPCSLRHEHVTCGVCEPPDFHVELRWWPCSTVRAIARALDVPIGDQQ